MNRFTVTIWCHDCTGEDPMGCFDGGSETIYDDPPDSGQPILDMERAFEIGDKTVMNCGPWDYYVTEVDENGKKIREVTSDDLEKEKVKNK